ncbi:oxygenase MpaB family protein [Palleronia aestuarii]|uniref:oxygenase MpaB family protein n=1 Tax=Palleronia aestuarii TaxID=568105 RepID=UPI001F32A00E|nr:oxygenase MpaB family protein [Palleronia aestuarii]
MSRGTAVADRIAALDPETEFETMARLLYAYEFSWDIERALEFALFRTYAVPAISGLLSSTREFETRPRKRYDDTELILCEPMEHGLESDRGRRAIGRMNAMHDRYRIVNADMLYVLSTFVCEPIRWLDRFGRRPMTAPERRAWFLYYRGLGQRMGIADIPHDLDEMERYNVAYEAQHFRYADTNRRIGEATRDLLLGFYLPRRLVPIGRPAVHAFLDPPLRKAMGFPPAPILLRNAMWAALRIRARLLRILPLRRRPRLLTQLPRPTYPGGYEIERLGTFRSK